jgi:hypothetical protein
MCATEQCILKQRIDKWRYRAALSKNNQSTKKEKNNDYRKQPIPLSIF